MIKMMKSSFPDCFYRVSVKALVFNDNNELLLIQEEDGTWELPGGGLDWGEEVVEGLKREIKEEVGVGIVSMEKQPTYIWTQERKKEEKYYVLFLGYKVVLSSYDFKKSQECVDSKFFNIKDLKNINLHVNLTKLPNLLVDIKKDV